MILFYILNSSSKKSSSFKFDTFVSLFINNSNFLFFSVKIFFFCNCLIFDVLLGISCKSFSISFIFNCANFSFNLFKSFIISSLLDDILISSFFCFISFFIVLIIFTFLLIFLLTFLLIFFSCLFCAAFFIDFNKFDY